MTFTFLSILPCIFLFPRTHIHRVYRSKAPFYSGRHGACRGLALPSLCRRHFFRGCERQLQARVAAPPDPASAISAAFLGKRESPRCPRDTAGERQNRWPERATAAGRSPAVLPAKPLARREPHGSPRGSGPVHPSGFAGEVHHPLRSRPLWRAQTLRGEVTPRPSRSRGPAGDTGRSRVCKTWCQGAPGRRRGGGCPRRDGSCRAVGDETTSWHTKRTRGKAWHVIGRRVRQCPGCRRLRGLHGTYPRSGGQKSEVEVSRAGCTGRLCGRVSPSGRGAEPLLGRQVHLTDLRLVGLGPPPHVGLCPESPRRSVGKGPTPSHGDLLSKLTWSHLHRPCLQKTPHLEVPGELDLEGTLVRPGQTDT